MKVFNAYKCHKCETTTERLAEPTSEVTCRVCGEVMTKVIAAALTNGNSAHGVLHRRNF